MLQDMFPGTELCRRINPDEAIVVGAAIEASRSVNMTDIVPRPLCIGEPTVRRSCCSLLLLEGRCLSIEQAFAYAATADQE
jgi:hypothetical protein